MEHIERHARARVELGQRTVADLLGQAERSAPSERGPIEALALDRARADYALAAGDRHDALVAWGTVLLVQSRRGPWASAAPTLERARQLFEQARALRASPEASAGLAGALQQLSRPLADREAIVRLDAALEITRAALQSEPSRDTAPSRDAPRQDDPAWHRLRVAHASVLRVRAQRTSSIAQRDEHLREALATFDSIPEGARSEWAWSVHCACLLTSATTRVPADESTLDAAERVAREIVARNENAAQAWTLLARVLRARSVYQPWSEEDARLREAQDVVDRARSLDSADYFATTLSGDVLRRSAERRPREQLRELAAVALQRYQSAIRLDETWPDAFIGAGWAALLVARNSTAATGSPPASWSEALASAQEALKRRADSAPAFRLLGNARRFAAQYAPLAEAEALLREAIEHFRRAAELRPDDHAVLADWANAHRVLAARREGADARAELTAALDRAAASLAIEPRHPHAHAARGSALAGLARLDPPDQRASLLGSALDAYRAALDVAPDLDFVLVGTASAELALVAIQREPDRDATLAIAQRRLDRALALRPDDDYALEILGDLRWQRALDKRDDADALRSARDAYDQARQIEPRRARAELRVADCDVRLARMLGDAERMRQAIAGYRSVTRDFPERADAHGALARALLRSVADKMETGDTIGALRESLREFQQAAHLAPPTGELLGEERRATLMLAEHVPDERDELQKRVALLEEAIARLSRPSREPASSRAL